MSPIKRAFRSVGIRLESASVSANAGLSSGEIQAHAAKLRDAGAQPSGWSTSLQEAHHSFADAMVAHHQGLHDMARHRFETSKVMLSLHKPAKG